MSASSLKYSGVLLLSIAFGSALSYASFYGFYFGARIFHSVPVARACDAAGALLLTPARLIYLGTGGLLDQSAPFAAPITYSVTNGIFLGLLIYACLRPILFRGKKRLN